MKRFINTLKQTILVGKSELIVYGLFSLFGGALGVIVWTIVMAVDGADGTYGTAGAMMALLLGMLGIIIMGMFSMHQDFNMAISLGKTRRQYVPAKYLLLVTACLLCFVISYLICKMELLLYPFVLNGAVCELNMEDILLNPVTILGVVILVPMLVMLCGALYLKFGMKFFWFGWVIWMCSCTMLPRILSASEHEPDTIWGRMGTALLNFFINSDAVKMVIGILVTGVLGLLVAYKLLSRQRVTL